jgi:hypothetical protein
LHLSTLFSTARARQRPGWRLLFAIKAWHRANIQELHISGFALFAWGTAMAQAGHRRLLEKSPDDWSFSGQTAV